MKITDEMLSAFLDSELPEPQMQHIRELLLQDEQLAERLAALAEVDLLLRQQASLIDGTPVPQQLMALLDEPEQGSVIRFPFWRRLAQPRQWIAQLQLVWLLLLVMPWCFGNSRTHGLRSALHWRLSPQVPVISWEQIQP